MRENKGRVTVPTDVDVIEDTLRIIDTWGADAIRDCDGTSMPEELKNLDVKKYATYYTTRKDNEWAMNNPDQIQQMYLMSEFITATDTTLRIKIMSNYYKDQLKPNTIHDIKRWWEVIDRTTGEIVSVDDWVYDEDQQEVIIHNTKLFHAYTVSFLAFVIWDPVHMYNSLTNEWEGEEHQMTYDVRLPKTQEYVLKKLERWMKEHPETDVIRYTTFFHQFTLMFDQYAREKFVDWFGYSASVSPYILEKFEKEVGYKFRPEFIINQGYHNSTFCVPTKEYKDFMDFQQREVAELIKKFVKVTHDGGKEVMMFLGDHWIGTEPFGKYFKDLGIDAVVGSVGNGTTLRLISEIPGVKYTEGRFLPYFFPDTFYEGGNPIKEAKENWVTARRAILRKPVDRIGYGGYLKLALQFPDFIDYITSVCNEFRELYAHVNGLQPFVMPFKVTVLNCWGKVRSWGTHMSAHALSYKEYYSYSGVVEALSGMPFDIQFMSFDDILADESCLDDAGVIINVGEAYDAFSGGEYWNNEKIVSAIRKFVHNGGGFIGIGEPSAYQREGKYFQLFDVLGIDKELGFSLSTDKYNWDVKEHFITEGLPETLNFGEEMKNIYALPETQIVRMKNRNVNLAVNDYGKGHAVYMSGLPFSFENARLLYRSLFFAAGKQEEIKKWYSDNYFVEINVYPSTNSFCVVNNTYEPQTAIVYKGDGTSFTVELEESEIKWFDI